MVPITSDLVGYAHFWTIVVSVVLLVLIVLAGLLAVWLVRVYRALTTMLVIVQALRDLLDER